MMKTAREIAWEKSEPTKEQRERRRREEQELMDAIDCQCVWCRMGRESARMAAERIDREIMGAQR